MRFLVTQTRHFIIDADDTDGAAETFDDLFRDYAEDDYEVEEGSSLTVVSMETVH